MAVYLLRTWCFRGSSYTSRYTEIVAITGLGGVGEKKYLVYLQVLMNTYRGT